MVMQWVRVCVTAVCVVILAFGMWALLGLRLLDAKGVDRCRDEPAAEACPPVSR